MKSLVLAFAALAFAVPAAVRGAAPAADSAWTSHEALVVGTRETHVHVVPLKDPNLAIILSVGTPGLGQLYVGDWQKGLAFLGGAAASLVVAGYGANALVLTAKDYDSPSRGGNGDGIVQFSEWSAWNEHPRQSFGDLSTARKAAIVGGLGVFAGVYVWNLIDARQSALAHNRRIFDELSGIRLGMGVSPTGRVQGQVSLAF